MEIYFEILKKTKYFVMNKFIYSYGVWGGGRRAEILKNRFEIPVSIFLIITQKSETKYISIF